VSKNVAVFVDVANIFYAAKAAGVDIDYVTLLKSAIAGRDFVRAYAYTGLDPENENQRQFHSFLARSGYRVVSKDIRKYGDGKIKANLDIELVVDLLRTARNLDVAVVVSGDGDFAPAIRAVQEMGVRVEVISFRGNTSSDLIEVADVFSDIAQVARVEKGSRSGRRVAAEGDLSMTEVPDKETEPAPRRRRTGRVRTGDRETAAAATPAVVPAAAAGAMPGNLIVLPGEKLARAGAPGTSSGTTSDATEPAVEDAALSTSEAPLENVAEGDGNRRRRRRRGGRGRGRGRGEGTLPAGEPGLDQEEEAAEFEPPRLPQHSTFGSVWDSQLGVPTTLPAAGGEVEDEEDLEDEPEIPEYLLAERRQRGGRGSRPGGARGGRGSAYQAALERERFGRGGSPLAGAAYSGPRRDDRARDERHRGGRSGRFERQPRGGEERQAQRRQSNGEPWTEVPPELEEMLRAQLAQKTAAAPTERVEPSLQPAGAAVSAGPDDSGGGEEMPPQAMTAHEAVPEMGAGALSPVAAPAGEPAARRRPGRPRRTAAAEPAAAVEGVGEASSPEPGVEAAPEAEQKPRRRPTRRKSAETELAPADTAGAVAVPAAEEAGAEAAPEAPEAKPRRRATRTPRVKDAEQSES
jgi:uncharacterized LabA/DUF88 family protein